MSWLIRTGSSRTSISYGGGGSITSTYLKRTGSTRNNISYVSISSNGTHKLLERYNTTRNGIRWNNLTFSFGPLVTKYPLYTDHEYQIGIGTYSGSIFMYKLVSYLNNGYSISYVKTLTDKTRTASEVVLITTTTSWETDSEFAIYIDSTYSNIKIDATNDSFETYIRYVAFSYNPESFSGGKLCVYIRLADRVTDNDSVELKRFMDDNYSSVSRINLIS